MKAFLAMNLSNFRFSAFLFKNFAIHQDYVEVVDYFSNWNIKLP